jgi:hypothetical protein
MKEIILENVGIITIEDGIKEFSIEELEFYYNNGIRHIDEEALSLLYLLTVKHTNNQEVTIENLEYVLVKHHYFNKVNYIYIRNISTLIQVKISLFESLFLVECPYYNIFKEIPYSNYTTLQDFTDDIIYGLLGDCWEDVF